MLSVVASAMAPFGRWNTPEDTRPVGIDGSSLSKALDVVPVSLTADGMVPFNTPDMLCAHRVGVHAPI